MGRKRIHPEANLSGAEKQKRYRAKRKAELEALKAAQVSAGAAPDLTALREQIETEIKQSWAGELQAERIAAERKEGRRLAKQADKNFTQGRTVGICNAAVYFVAKDRTDITRALLSHFAIDRETAEAALQADKRTKSMTLETLDKSGVWGNQPPAIK